MITRTALLILFIASHLISHSQYAEFADPKNSEDEKSFLFTHSWNLVELNGVSTLQPGAKQAYITFQQSDFINRISGFTGCNYIGGRINLPGNDDIVFHPDLLTNQNCSGSTVESNLLQTLLDADGWSEKNGQLVLTRRGKITARWSPFMYSNANLVGSWDLAYLTGLPAPFSEIFPVDHCPRIVFTGKQDQATGNSGCHEFTSKIVMNPTTIVFTGATACDTNCLAKEENRFLSALKKVNGYIFKDDKTLVLIEDDKAVMALTRMKPLQASPATASKD